MSAKDEILYYMRSKIYKPMTMAELMVEFEISKRDSSMFSKLLSDLEREGAIIKTRKDRYGVPEKMNLILGTLQGNRNGFGFVIPINTEVDDLYVSLENTNGAMHKDKVIARPLPTKGQGNRVEAEIIKVLERANRTVVGRFEKARNVGFVVPDNSRLFYDVFIPVECQKGAQDGDKVVVKINRWPEVRRNPEGRVLEIFGKSGTPGVDMESLIYRLNLPREFSKETLREAQEISSVLEPEELEGRKDFRSDLIFTIDGEDAKDFDDAISLLPLEGPWVQLGVHIADVTAYVKESSAIDKEGAERATSIYLVDRAIPMLPEELSNNLCSLQPKQERLTVSVLMELNNKTGHLRDFHIYKSVIESKNRLTYTQVNRILDGDVQGEDKAIVKTLNEMAQLSKLLQEQKRQRGNIDFDLPEPYIELAEDGEPISITKRPRGKGEALIEDFMVLANEVVAELLCNLEIPSIYRIHESPDPEDIVELNEFLHNIGYHIKGVDGKILPRSIQEVLAKVKGQAEERIVQTVVLRSLKQAKYHPINLGHFGLASQYYTHFTSPIRRYPDLMVHRILKEFLEEGLVSLKRQEYLKKELPEICKHSSDMERQAMEAERESMKLKMVEYMAKQVGQCYTGHISTVVPFGFFVELDNMVEGLVHVSNLLDDYYHYDEKSRLLIGDNTRKMYKLGDKVDIMVNKVNKHLLEIDFVLCSDINEF